MCSTGKNVLLRKYTEKEISAKLIGKGGLNSYLGTNDMREVTKRANEGDAKAAEVKQAFLLQKSSSLVRRLAPVLRNCRRHIPMHRGSSALSI